MTTERKFYATTGTRTMRGGWRVNECRVIYAADYSEAYRIATRSCYRSEQVITLEEIPNHD
jgi:hypothetical protein